MNLRTRLACVAAVAALWMAIPAWAADRPKEYRITAYPSYRITDKWMGVGYAGLVSKPDGNYHAYYLASAAYYKPSDTVQLWAGLIGVYTETTAPATSNLMEYRPFVGVKFIGAKPKSKIRYYNWTRYELRETETLNSHSWATVHRLRNQSRIEIPLAAADKRWTPKSWYLLADIEPIYRSDTGQIDPLRLRAGFGYIANPRLLVELQYYNQYTQPGGGGLEYTDDIIRLNFKILTKQGLLAGLGDDID